jgi:hypothetical protein
MSDKYLESDTAWFLSTDVEPQPRTFVVKARTHDADVHGCTLAFDWHTWEYIILPLFGSSGQ